MTRNLIFCVFLLLLFASCNQQQEKENYLVILSMDGFRWDYPNMTDTPNLDSIAKTGVKAEAIRPAFPSKTFPNHYTMATGLYPDKHGIVNNHFYDPATKTTYSMRDRP
jgi:predicted AlkP superfamily pyrophosphatase or phosphodiesterase